MKRRKRAVWHEIVLKQARFRRSHAIEPNLIKIPLRLWERMRRETLAMDGEVQREVIEMFSGARTPICFGPNGWNPGVRLFGMNITVNEGGNFEVTYKAP